MKLETLFRFRRQCMAAAIAMVLLFHLKTFLPDSPFKTLASFSFGGVDLFFFVSGAGCFFSWTRDRDPGAFLRRRAKRILPVYLPFILGWIALRAAREGIGPVAALANLLAVQGFVAVEPSFNWYVSAMWLSYLLTPWLAALAERCDTGLRAAAATAGLVLLSVAFWGDRELVIILTRLPVFFVGMCFAAESTRRERLTKAETALLLGLIPLGAVLLWETAKYWPDLLWDCGLHWYPFLLITPGACAGLALLASGLQRLAAGRALNRAAGFVGELTFELYLSHIGLEGLPPRLLLPLTLLLAALLHALARLLRRALEGGRRARGKP